MNTKISSTNTSDSGLSTQSVPLSVSKPPCTICLDKSSGFHYGTHACEGCKGFFRRMVTNSILIQLVLQCTGTSKYQCEINPGTRNNCQRCRLQKCFQMGMTRYRTRLGRRTKAIALQLENKAIPVAINTLFTDDEMLKLIKRENNFFNNNEIDEEMQPPPVVEMEVPQAKCIKYKAKLYSEKNSKSYQKYSNNVEMSTVSCPIYSDGNSLYTPCATSFSKQSIDRNSNEKSSDFDIANESYTKIDKMNSNSCQDLSIGSSSECDSYMSRYFDINPNIYPQSSLPNSSSSVNNSLGPKYDRRSSTFNDHSEYTNNTRLKIKFSEDKKIQFFEKIRINSEKCQIENLCSKIRVFRNCNSNTEDYRHFSNCKATINTLTEYFYHPNLEEMEEYYRTRVDQVSYIYNPLLVFTEMIKELSDMSRKIFAFFKRLPDLELFELITMESGYIKKKIIQTLYVWLVRFVNVSEKLLYNTSLTMKIPHSVLFQTPLKHFFELLFQFAEICNTVLTMEIDDLEISLLSALIVTFPKDESNNCSKILLQPDNILKVRFLYCASLYDYIFTERCTQNHDLTNVNNIECWIASKNESKGFQDVC